MRISVVSLHTSPAAQPGQGDAGGMNVYVDQSVRALAAAGHSVDVFTADPGGIDGSGDSSRTTMLIADSIRLHHLPIDAASKDELADAIDELAALLLAEPAYRASELIWAHYWISAEAALRSQEMLQETAPESAPREVSGQQTPNATTSPTTPPKIIVSMHTIGAVKNRDSDTSHERPQRLQAEDRIASAADLMVANTPAERRDLIHELGAEPDSIVVARPGVDHELFSPGDRLQARAELGFSPEESIVLYVGRMQFIKGTDVIVDALAGLRENNPHLASHTRGILLGAESGMQSDASAATAATGSSTYLRELASAIHSEPSVEVRRPVPAQELVTYYRAADVLLVPSRSESFGLVAAEAAASGLPAIASAVGGLPDIVEHGHSGVLIADHNPRHWAMALERLLLDADLRRELAEHAVARSSRFDWSLTVQAVLGALGEPNETLQASVESTDRGRSTTMRKTAFTAGKGH